MKTTMLMRLCLVFLCGQKLEQFIRDADMRLRLISLEQG